MYTAAPCSGKCIIYNHNNTSPTGKVDKRTQIDLILYPNLTQRIKQSRIVVRECMFYEDPWIARGNWLLWHACTGGS